MSARGSLIVIYVYIHMLYVYVNRVVTALLSYRSYLHIYAQHVRRRSGRRKQGVCAHSWLYKCPRRAHHHCGIPQNTHTRRVITYKKACARQAMRRYQERCTCEQIYAVYMSTIVLVAAPSRVTNRKLLAHNFRFENAREMHIYELCDKTRTLKCCILYS